MIFGAFQMKNIVFKFRKLAGADKARRIRDKWRDHFLIAMFTRVQVHHKLNERALEVGSSAAQKSKPRTGHFPATFEIQNTQFFAEFPMFFCSKRKSALYA